jgi:hypothetical protein
MIVETYLQYYIAVKYAQNFLFVLAQFYTFEYDLVLQIIIILVWYYHSMNHLINVCQSLNQLL